MWKVLRASQVLTLSLLTALAVVSQGLAEDILNLNQNQTGFSLPGVSLPQGQDEVHASDGTTCRSAVSGSGAYLDLGVIRGDNTSSQSNSDIATYGRVVIPISDGRRSASIAAASTSSRSNDCRWSCGF